MPGPMRSWGDFLIEDDGETVRIYEDLVPTEAIEA